jgi:hypothetical protein
MFCRVVIDKANWYQSPMRIRNHLANDHSSGRSRTHYQRAARVAQRGTPRALNPNPYEQARQGNQAHPDNAVNVQDRERHTVSGNMRDDRDTDTETGNCDTNARDDDPLNIGNARISPKTAVQA